MGVWPIVEALDPNLTASDAWFGVARYWEGVRVPAHVDPSRLPRVTVIVGVDPGTEGEVWVGNPSRRARLEVGEAVWMCADDVVHGVTRMSGGCTIIQANLFWPTRGDRSEALDRIRCCGFGAGVLE